MENMNIISYGGGVQTAALLALTAQGKVESPATHAVFADTGSELVATYDHILDVIFPYACENGIDFKVVKSDKGKLHEWDGEVMLPMYWAEGGFTRRQCTRHWKIVPIRRWLRSQGAKKATVQIGISWDEAHRAKDADVKWLTHRWPLLEMRMTRQDCINVLDNAGIPVPPKSSCWMCPYRRTSEWTMLRAQTPSEFEKAVEYEKSKDGMFLSYKLKPLEQVVGMQDTMFDDDECGGYCWT